MSLRRALSLAWLIAAPAFAQRGPALDVQLAATGTHNDGPAVSAVRMLADEHVQELLRNAFPAQLHFRLELWRLGRPFNELEKSTAWDVLVQYDPYSQRYRVARLQGADTRDLGSFATLGEAEAEVEKPYRAALVPAEVGQRYYYTAVLEVRLLQYSDLDELQRWLRGDLKPAVSGRSNPFSAIKNGLGRLLSRVLGGEKHDYRQQSPIFTAE